MFSGWSVASAIPYKYLTGLVTGEYSLAGGVIRHAIGSSQGGQIVAHLLPASSSLLSIVPGLSFIPGLVANYQLSNLSTEVGGITQGMGAITEMIQINSSQLSMLSGQLGNVAEASQHLTQMVAGTALLSGLGVGVSCLGFIAMNKKLGAIDEKLQSIRGDIKEIKEFLELGERAELRAALSDLLKVDQMNNMLHRDKILNDRRQTLMKLNEKYKELLAQSTTIEEFVANEEYYSITGLAYCRCTAELGMFEVAAHEIRELNDFWVIEARRFARLHLLGKHPERFLASDFSKIAPISALASWMDFAYDEAKGYRWIDGLRFKSNTPWYDEKPWYKKDVFDIVKTDKQVRSKGQGLHKEEMVVIPSLQKLLARNNVFEGYVSQYELLEQEKLSPSEFNRKIIELPTKSVVNGYHILELDSKRAA